jgi:glycosyltransferase involved in cell wall biosynthesis
VGVLWPPYDLEPELVMAGITVHRLRMGHRWNLAQGVGRIVRLLLAGRYDVVHAHLFFPTLYVGLSRPLEPRPRRVVTFHNLGFDSYPHRSAWRRVRKRFQAEVTRQGFDGRIGVSEAVARHYERHLGLPPSKILPNALSLGPAPPTAGDRAPLAGFGLDPEGFVLLVPSRFVPEKGHRYLLEALTILERRGLRPQALLLGDGPVEAVVRSDVERRGLADRVRLAPSVDHAELLRLVAAADVFVSASTFEGLPLSMAEAMALGRPIVATRVGGVPDLVADGVTGLLVPPGDPAALADALSRLMGDAGLRDAMGREGRNAVEGRYRGEVVGAELTAYYRKLLAVTR